MKEKSKKDRGCCSTKKERHEDRSFLEVWVAFAGQALAVFVPGFDHRVGAEVAEEVTQQGGGFFFQDACGDLGTAVIGQGEQVC